MAVVEAAGAETFMVSGSYPGGVARQVRDVVEHREAALSNGAIEARTPVGRPY